MWRTNFAPASLRGRVIFEKGNEVTIGDRIRRIRKKRRLTQAELAMMSGLSLSAIQGYEQGRYEPKRKPLESIAEVFKIPVDELYDMPAELSTNLAEVGTDCISRQQAIKAIEEEWDGCCSEYPATQIIYDTTEAIERLPIIQPKRGKWIHHPEIGWGETWLCDQCGEKTTSTVMGKPRWNFCPMCGSYNGGENEI